MDNVTKDSSLSHFSDTCVLRTFSKGRLKLPDHLLFLLINLTASDCKNKQVECLNLYTHTSSHAKSLHIPKQHNREWARIEPLLYCTCFVSPTRSLKIYIWGRHSSIHFSTLKRIVAHWQSTCFACRWSRFSLVKIRQDVIWKTG